MSSDSPPPQPDHSVPRTYENPSSFDRPPARAPPPAPPPAPQRSQTSDCSPSTSHDVRTPTSPTEHVLHATPTSTDVNRSSFVGNRSRAHSLAPPIAPAPVDFNTNAFNGNRSRTNSLVPPYASGSVETTITAGKIAVTPPSGIRPDSYHSESVEGETATRGRRKSWLPTISRQEKTKSRQVSQEFGANSFGAWVNAGEAKIIYNSNLLHQGEQIPELWNEGPEADTFVYLFPRESGRGPQMKVYSSALSASQPITQLMFGDIYSGRARGKSFDGRGSLTIEDATRNLAVRAPITPPYTPRTNTTENQSTTDSSNESIRSFAEGSKEIHLYFPTGVLTTGPHFSVEEIQRLIDARNLFAFLNGQPLVATPICPTNFRVLLSIAFQLRRFNFTNIDGSTFGEAVIASTNFLVEDQGIADVRSSLEKNLEALILGEQLRSVDLYNEAFAHAVGKYASLESIKSPLWSEISANTLNKLQRSDIELKGKINSAELSLINFEFPSLFAGIAASISSDEARLVRFGKWKSHFMYMRRQTLSFYKQQHGSWPPKANPKKNNFVQGGLNRLVLKGLYQDFCCVYDYLANRTSLTPRGVNEGEDTATNDVDPVHAAMRKLLAEFDRCSPPVLPPIPYDVPLVPDISTVEPNFPKMGPNELSKLMSRKMKDHVTTVLLAKSSGPSDGSNPLLQMYREFEAKEAKGMNILELSEMRYGHWIFIYAVLQSLPLLVMDAPDLKFTEGVETFLCQLPLGGLPWINDAGIKMSWYGVEGGAVVSLPSDVVNYGHEATYRRSHCWVMGTKWLNGEIENDRGSSGAQGELSPLVPPPGFSGGELGLRPSVRQRQRNSYSSNGGLAPHGDRSVSRHSRQSQRNSIALGLERLPIPAGEEPHFGAVPGYFGSPSGTPGTGTTKSSSRATSPISHSTAPSNRASSHGRLDSPGTSVKGSTFDDILGGMPDTGKKSRRWI